MKNYVFVFLVLILFVNCREVKSEVYEKYIEINSQFLNESIMNYLEEYLTEMTSISENEKIVIKDEVEQYITSRIQENIRKELIQFEYDAELSDYFNNPGLARLQGYFFSGIGIDFKNKLTEILRQKRYFNIIKIDFNIGKYLNNLYQIQQNIMNEKK